MRRVTVVVVVLLSVGVGLFRWLAGRAADAAIQDVGHRVGAMVDATKARDSSVSIPVLLGHDTVAVVGVESVSPGSEHPPVMVARLLAGRTIRNIGEYSGVLGMQGGREYIRLVHAESAQGTVRALLRVAGIEEGLKVY